MFCQAGARQHVVECALSVANSFGKALTLLFPTLNPNVPNPFSQKANEFCMQVPDIAWFARQREALGLEATVYAFMAVGGTKPYTFSMPYHHA
jgi:hypothetical protein